MKRTYMELLLTELNFKGMEEALECPETKGAILTNKKFESMEKKVFNKKDTAKVTHITIAYSKNSKRFYIKKITTDSAAESRVFNPSTAELKKAKVRNGNLIKVANDYTDEIIMIDIDRTAKNVPNFNTAFYKTPIIIVRNTNTGWITPLLECKGYFLNLDSGEKQYELPKNKGVEISRYTWCIATASSKRNDTSIFKKCDRKSVFEIYDEGTCGALSVIHEGFLKANSLVTSKKDADDLRIKTLKQMSYVGNIGTGSKNCGVVPGYHVLHGKWFNSTNEWFLDEQITKLLEEKKEKELKGLDTSDIDASIKKHEGAKLELQLTQDGTGYINAIQLAVIYYKRYGYIIEPAVLIGRLFQIRPATVKAAGLVVAPDVYKQLIVGTLKLCNKLNSEHLGDKDWKPMQVSVYGDADKSLYLVDKNCIKAEYDYSRPVDFHVLATSKESEGSLSKQITKNCLKVAMDVDRYEEALEMIETSQMDFTSTRLLKSIDPNRKSEICTASEIIKSIEDGFVGNTLIKMAPAFLKESKALYELTAKQSIDASVKGIDKFGDELIIENRRLVSDVTFIATGGEVEGILNFGEVIINNRKVTKAVMFKYPVNGIDEQLPVINQRITGKNSIHSRLKYLQKNGVISVSETNAIVEFYRGLHSSVACLSPHMFNSFSCAGLDYDYDGGAFLEKTNKPEEELTQEEYITNQFVDMFFERVDATGYRGVRIQL